MRVFIPMSVVLVLLIILLVASTGESQLAEPHGGVQARAPALGGRGRTPGFFHPVFSLSCAPGILVPPLVPPFPFQGHHSLQLPGKNCPKWQFPAFRGCLHVSLCSSPVAHLRSHWPHPNVTHTCPGAWLGFQGKCYFFSEAEGDWTTGQESCEALGASLALISTVEELVRTGLELLHQHQGGKHEKKPPKGGENPPTTKLLGPNLRVVL